MHKQFLADKDKLEKQDAEMKKKLDAGEITKAQYKSWRSNLEKQIQKDARKLAIILGGADQLATEDVNMQIPEFYSDAENYEMYRVEKDLNVSMNFDLVNKNSITRATYGAFFADIDYDKNTKWNQRRIRSAITAGIIAGESIPDIANRLKPLVGGNEKSAIRNARTWVGAAVSGGQQESAENAVKAGVMIDKWWQSVVDLRTRISHRYMNNEHVSVNEAFSNGAMFPKDPELPPEERYNCRCVLKYLHKGLTPDFDGQMKALPEGMTYDDWLKGKEKEKKSGVVNGKDISGTWKRREDKFDFDIEDAINAQGFDGLPKVVDEKDFDKAVEESGIITNRGYTAPNQEALDKYHEDLLSGKWYVRCSGGNMYGYGMYTAGNYGKVLSGKSLGTASTYSSSGFFGRTETMTFDKSANIVEFSKIFELRKEEPYNYLSKKLEEDNVKLTPLQQGMAKMRCTGEMDMSLWAKYSSSEMMNAENSLEKYYDKYLDKAFEYAKKFDGMDYGVYAALKGYDAIEANKNGDDAFFVVLNRTKLIIKR